MSHFTIRQFMDACHGIWYGPPELLDKAIQGVTVDSRLVKKDSLFVATPGERADGHRFIPDVYEKGALCAVSQQKLTNPAGPYLLVENTLQALKLIGRRFLSRSSGLPEAWEKPAPRK